MRHSINSRGFTLIELMVSMVLIAIIIAITIPNIMGIIDNNKTNKYIEDAKRLVVTAEYKVRSDNVHVRPKTNKYIILNLAYLDNSEFNKAPYGGTYDFIHSFVVMYKGEDRQYHYLVQLLEEKDGQYRGVRLTDYENLFDDNAKQYVNTYSYDPDDSTKTSPYIKDTNTYVSETDAGNQPTAATINSFADTTLDTTNGLMAAYCLKDTEDETLKKNKES